MSGPVKINHPVSLVSVPQPFAAPRRYELPAILTFAEMAARVDELPPLFWQGGGVIIVSVTDLDGNFRREFRVPQWSPDGLNLWATGHPKCADDEKITVAFAVNVQGGGGGGRKNVLAIVAMVAVIALSFAVSGGALTALGASQAAFGAGTIGAKVAGALVSIGGAMAISALTKPPALPSLGTPNPKSPNTSAVQVNVLSAGASFPRVAGTKRIMPPALCEPLTEFVNDNVITEVALGLAGPHLLKHIRVGGKPLPEGSEIQIRRGLSSDPLQKLIKRYGHTDNVNLQLSNFKHTGSFSEDTDVVKIAAKTERNITDLLPQWHSVFLRSASKTVGGPVNEHHINLNFPAGLYNTADSEGDFVTLPFLARLRRIDPNKGPQPWVQLPEFHYCRNYEGGFTISIRVLWKKKADRPAAPPARDAEGYGGYGGMWAYTKTPPQTFAPRGTGWKANAYFIDEGRRGPDADIYSALTIKSSNLLNMVGKKDRWEVFLDPKRFPPGQYEFQIKRGAPFHGSNWDERKRFGNTFGGKPIAIDPFGYWKWTKDGTGQFGGAFEVGTFVAFYPDAMIAEVSVSSVVAVINKQPSPSKDVCVVALRLKNVGNAGAISCLASGLTRDWSGTSWSVLKATSNPAPHAREIYAGTLNANKVPASLIDDDAFVAFRSQCNAKGYQVNAELIGLKVPDAFALVTGCGYGGPANGEKFSVVWDRDRSSEGVTQVFTPRNMNNFRWINPCAKFSDGISAIYSNKNNDYQDDNVVVWYGAKRETLEEQRIEGLVTQGEVVRRLIFDQNHVRKRQVPYSWLASVESIRCKKGDLVGVQSPILMSKSGYARIKEVTLNGAETKITGLVLDQKINAFAAVTSPSITLPEATFGIEIQHADGAVTTHAVTIDSDRITVNFNTLYDVDADIKQGCIVAAGPLGTESLRLIVSEIRPKDTTSAEIIAFDEAPELTKALEVARTAEVADDETGAPIPYMLDFRYPQNSGYLPLLAA